MNSLSLNDVSDKLIALAEEEETLYPDYYKAELDYNNEKAKTLMSSEVSGLAAQPQREAECLRIMAQKPIYKKYHDLAIEYHRHEKQYRIYMQIARNLNNYGQ